MSISNQYIIGNLKATKGALLGTFLFLFLYALYLQDVIQKEFLDIVAIGSDFSSTYYLIGMCIITLIISIAHKKVFSNNAYAKSYLIMCATIIVMSFLHFFSVKVSAREVYVGIICWFTCFFSFYYLALTDELRRLRIYFYFFFCFLVYTYLDTFYYIGVHSALPFTMNSSYLLLAFFPLLMLISGRKSQLVVTLVIVLCLLFSNKRGGTVAALLGLIVFYIVEYLPKGKGRHRGRFLSILSLGAIVFGLWYFVQSLLSLDNVVLIDRFVSVENDDGSGRVLIWTEVLNSFESSGFLEKLFGHGYDSVRLYIPEHMSAHNDYLEVLFDFGIIAFIAYLGFIVMMFVHAYKLIKDNSPVASSFSSSIVFFTVLSFMSHVLIYPAYMILYCMYWGYAFGIERKMFYSQRITKEITLK